MAKRKHGNSRKLTTQMDKNPMMKWILIPCVIVVVASCIYLIWYINNQNSTYSNITYIRSFMTSSGQLNDFQNKLGMHNPDEDIKWFKTDDEIRIEFGRIILTWEPKEFYAKENLDLLNTIGITTKILENADGDRVLHIFYCGKEIERWVR